MLLKKDGRFFCYEPGLPVIASGASMVEAHEKFLNSKAELLEASKYSGVDIGDTLSRDTGRARSLDIRATPSRSLIAVPSRNFLGELALFICKTVILLLIIAGLGWKVAQVVSSADANSKALSLNDISRKSEEVARDIRTVSTDSRETLRRSIAALSRFLAPLGDAWRNPDGIPEPVNPASP